MIGAMRRIIAGEGDELGLPFFLDSAFVRFERFSARSICPCLHHPAMTPEQLNFFTANVAPFETALLAHPIGSLFSGALYLPGGEPLREMRLPGLPMLDAAQVARLFLAPDDSVVVIQQTPPRDDGAPRGIEVISDYTYLPYGRPVSVIAYDDEDGGMVRINSLHLRRLILKDSAPERFATVAIGLMACTAYRLGFRKISLFAAGKGPLDDACDFIGYAVWPRMGFDAPLRAVDLQGAVHLASCTTVGDVMTTDSQWWDDHGTGRDMELDLTAGSRSWGVLLDYAYPIVF